jgi:hypothetical protein
MTKSAALKEAVSRWGRGAGVRFNPDAAVGDQRVELLAEMKAHNAVRPERRYENGKQTPEWRAWRKTADGLLGRMHAHRCEVGAVFMGIAFEIKGGGDTWEEAFTAAARR